jgi:DNA-binding GntR family transcriptional regulator
LQSIAQEHHLILKAMFRRDMAETVALCRMHVVSARDDMIASIRATKA